MSGAADKKAIRGKLKISKETKESIRTAVPRRYARAAGIEPYFIPLFGRIYWQRVEVVSQLALGEVSARDGPIADLGCGLGVLVALLGKIFETQVIGVDEYPIEMLKVAESISEAVSSSKSRSFTRGDLSQLGFQSDTFQACFCLDVLEHVANVEDCLEEIQRVMKARGSLFVTVPVEGKLLKIAREVTSLHGRRRALSPHWHGTIANHKEFKVCLSNYFDILKEEYIPNVLFPYDVMFFCKKQ
jgi:ubiquinone/menaquinone biosynthesis C-methylase UbiE